MFKPNEVELITIMNMLRENKSFRSIGTSLGVSGKTIKAFIDRESIDLTDYDPKQARGKARVKELTADEVEEIVKYLEEGKSMRDIAKIFDRMSLPTLSRELDRLDIDYNSYKVINKKKFKLSKKDLSDIKIDLANGTTIKEIASKYECSTVTMSNYLREVRLIVDEDTTSDNDKKAILHMHENNITISNINTITNVRKQVIKTIIKESGSKKTEKQKYHANSKYNANSPENLLMHLNQFNQVSNKNTVVYSDVIYVLENISSTKFIDIIKTLKADYDEIKRFIGLIGKGEIFTLDHFKNYSYFDELLEDMSKPHLSNVELSMIYGPSYMTIGSWRKDLVGDVKTYFRSTLSRSKFEIEFELLLNELDLAFIPEYMVNDLKYDYYLGHHILIELNGEYWHKDNEESDRKKIDNVANDYELLIIDEDDFYKNRGLYKDKVKGLYISRVTKQFNL